MLPPAEIRILTRLSLVAIDMALDGFAGEGYTSLIEGFSRVRDQRDAGKPWGEELVEQYRHTLDDYADRYGVARE